MSAYDVAPMTSHASSNVSRVVAVTVTSIAPANSSTSPTNRDRASSGPNSPAV